MFSVAFVEKKFYQLSGFQPRACCVLFLCTTDKLKFIDCKFIYSLNFQIHNYITISHCILQFLIHFALMHHSLCPARKPSRLIEIYTYYRYTDTANHGFCLLQCLSSNSSKGKGQVALPTPGYYTPSS